MELIDQVAIVTGGGGGLGRAMALALAQEGVKIMIAEVREPEGDAVTEEIRAAGGIAEKFIGDLSDEAMASSLIQTCRTKLSGLNILINNAGLRMETREDGGFEDWRCLRRRPTHEVPVEEWDLVLRVNLRAPYLCTHFALPHLLKQKSGTIINISSDAGIEPAEGKSAYCASKFGIEGFTKVLADEYRSRGISANSIYPGGRADVDGRGGVAPEVMVPAVLFLCKQDGQRVTGQTIRAADWNLEHG